MRFQNILSACVLYVSLMQAAFADQVWLSNGDVVSGKLVHLQDANVVIESSMLGSVTIDVANVQSLSSDQTMTITFVNQDRVTGRLKTENGAFLISTDRFGELRDVSLAQILSIHQADVNVSLSTPVTRGVATTKQIADQSAKPIDTRKDVITLLSGDRLVGKVLSIDATNVSIDTEFTDPIVISRDKIQTIDTQEPMTVVFKDDAYVTGKIKSYQNGQLTLQSERTEESQPFALEEVSKAVKGDPQQIVLDQQKVKLTGRLNIGLSRSSGNSDNENYAGLGELRARTPTNRITLRGERIFERSDGDKTEDQTFGSIKYDQFLNEKWFMFVSTSFEEDEIELLNLRTALAAGLGYQFFERDDLFLSMEAGPAYVNEDFDEQEDNDSISLRWGIDYEQNIFGWLSLFHYQDGLFGVEDTDDIIIKTRNGVRFPLGSGFNATAQANFDWDKSPAEGVSSTDKEYLFTLGYEF